MKRHLYLFLILAALINSSFAAGLSSDCKLNADEIEAKVDAFGINQEDCALGPRNALRQRLFDLELKKEISYERYKGINKKFIEHDNACRKAIKAHKFILYK